MIYGYSRRGVMRVLWWHMNLNLRIGRISTMLCWNKSILGDYSFLHRGDGPAVVFHHYEDNHNIIVSRQWWVDGELELVCSG